MNCLMQLRHSLYNIFNMNFSFYEMSCASL